MHLFFANANHSVAYGGVERWMIDTAAGLERRGHTAVLFGRPGAPWLRAGGRAGLRVREGIHGTWLARVLRFRSAVVAECPDLVIVKGTKVARWAAWTRATGAPGRAVIFLGRTHELHRGKWVHRYTWRHVDAGIVVADGAARWYRERGFGPADKISVLWKGVDVEAFDRARGRAAGTRATLGLGAGDLAIGMVGRLAWEKGIEDLLAAVRLVQPGLPQARVFVIGGGRDAAAVATAAAAPEFSGRVTLLGQRDDVPELLGAMDVVVQSSRREAMAQTTLEAMAAGRAVVSTATVGADEAIENGVSGVLVPVGDPPALAGALVALARDPARRQALGAAARARIAAHFTARHALDRAEGIFRALVADGRGPA